MKRISRLTALLLALLLIFQMTAVATEVSSEDIYVEPTPIPQENLDAAIMATLRNNAVAVAAVDNVKGFGVVNEDCNLNYSFLNSEKIAQGTIVTVYEGTFELLFGIWGVYYKVSYNGRDGYIQTKYLNLCTCNVQEGAGLDAHADGCPDKMYYISICALNAEEIAANWAEYTEEGQAFILLYLSWYDQEKLAALQGMLGDKPSKEVVVDGFSVQLFGNIPENVTVEVDSYAFDYYGDAVRAHLSSYSTVAFAYSISLINEDGTRWQPSNGEKIRIDLDAFAMGLPEGTRLGVLHEDSDGDVEKLGISIVKDGKLSFETGSFSTFYGYTVDFVFNGSMFKIPGGTSIELAQVFTELGITDWTAEQAVDVVFSNPELLRPYKNETTGSWMLESLQAFSTEELLTITFDTGEVLLINVYDATEISGDCNLSGDHDGITVTENAVVTLTGDVTLTGTVAISSGKTLTIKTKGDYSISYNGTSTGIYMFSIPKTSKLEIDGSNQVITLNGGKKEISVAGCEGSLSFNNVTITEFMRRGIDILGTNNNGEGRLNGTITLEGCIFKDNGKSENVTGDPHTGTIMYVVGGSATTVTMSNCTVENCKSWNGAIRTNGNTVCKLTVTGCTFKENVSHINGGVFYWNANKDFTDGNGVSVLSISGCEFIGNSAYNKDNGSLLEGGGAIFCEANMQLFGSKFTENYSGGRGGAININTYNGSNNGMIIDIKDGITISGNMADHEGGGISMYIRNTDDTEDGSKFAINVAGDILNNKSNTNGGGVYVFDQCQKTHTSEVNINGGTISGNSAVNGAGIAVLDTDVTVSTGVVKKNTASNNGGGIYAISETRDVVVSLEGGTVGNNSAANGAGIAVLPSGSKKVTVEASGADVTKNIASGMGGGLYVTGANGLMEVTGGSIGENVAVYGGGVYLTDSAQLNITNGNIDGNQANNGGGVYLTNSACLDINGGSISKNKATGTPDVSVTTAYNSNNIPGVGGGISVVGNASASQKTMIDVHGDPIGVYGNTADFAADDVFASGQGTKLTLPAKADMSINDPEYTATTGWFEDYATGDTEYERVGLFGNSNATAERYRKQIENNQLTVRAFVNKAEYTDADTSVREPNHYTNEENVYVCITLGVVNLPSGSLKISKVFEEGLAEVYKEQIFVFTITGTTVMEEDISFTVQTKGSTPVVISDLPMGTYTVREDENWSWRFDCVKDEVITLEEGNSSGEVKMQNNLKKDQWLDYDISNANTYEIVNVTP